MNAIWGEIEALDNVVLPNIQIEMLMKVRKLVERTMFWLQSNRSHVTSIDEIVSEFSTSIISMSKQMLSFAPDAKQGRIKNRQAEYQTAGVTESLALKMSSLELEFTCLDIIAIHGVVKAKKADVIAVYFSMIDELKLNWLYERISQLPRKNYWQSLARSALRDDLHVEVRGLLSLLFTQSAKKLTVQSRVEHWCEQNTADIERYLHLVSVIQAENEMEIEQLSVILKELHTLIEKSKVKQV